MPEMLHDYSTGGTGAVPPGERRSRWHFVALWITLAAGFTYLFLGFEYHRVGYPLAKAVAAAALGAVCYLCYALPASYLGSTTGQTHALLTRSIFGVVGSVLLFGAWGQQLFPGQTSAPSLGLVPVEAWALAGVLYLALAAVAARTPGVKTLLGFARPLRGGAAP